MRTLRFSKTYFIATLAILTLEIIIALYIRDRFIRPYVGDIFAIILVYTFLKTWLHATKLVVAIAALFVAFVIEFLQALHFIEHIGLSHNTFAKILLGTSFSWLDLLCYLAGFLLIVLVEKLYFKRP